MGVTLPDIPIYLHVLFALECACLQEVTIQNDISLTVATSAVSSHCFEWVVRSSRSRLTGSEAKLLHVGRRLYWKVAGVLMADGNKI
jgi:hypothetical protein